jgi:hypothetical protein
MNASPLTPDHPADPVAIEADEDYVLEPVEDFTKAMASGEPIVRDVRGRLWRARRRPSHQLGRAALLCAALPAVVIVLWLVS